MSFRLDRTYYDKVGNATPDEKKACAKAVVKTVEGGALGNEVVTTLYYVKYAGYIYDPHNMNEVELRYRDWRMKEVSKRVFDLYLDFLKTRQEHFRINAERLINVN